MHFNAKDMTGLTFGRLKVLEVAGSRGGTVRWICHCACGVQKEVEGAKLRRGITTSCGCYRRSIAKEVGKKIATHGMRGTPEYNVWDAMLRRCKNKTHPEFKNYGERGIQVCERWRKFENFFEDMGKRPSDDHSIDREDNNGNYEPENCRWAIATTQQQNRRNNHVVTAFGRTGALSSFFERGSYCNEYQRAVYRINRFGWSAERAIATPALG